MNEFIKIVLYMRLVGETEGKATIDEMRSQGVENEIIARVALMSAAFKYAFGYEEGE